ncbi:MAG TPA: penicillin acylase family protein [Deltaproteobacteria bacterium]|nr:penicillin acylase family protein [Deltaproteobacteria bacterium]
MSAPPPPFSSAGYRLGRPLHIILAALLMGILAHPVAHAGNGNGGGGLPEGAAPVTLPGLIATVQVVTDRVGSPHIFAQNDLDLIRVQGYVHARDRFWQMDATRRQVSGDLGELLGPTAISGDIQMRTLGLRRAAERSVPLLSSEAQALLQAYADGINAWLAANPLPPEYAQLELTKARPWTVVDSIAIGKGIAASLSLEIDAGLIEKLDDYMTKCAAATPPCDGEKLLFEDVQRFAPMDPASTVPDATGTHPYLAQTVYTPKDRTFVAQAAARVRRLRAKMEGVPLLAKALHRKETFEGSNEWGVTAAASETGRPMIANDPHLALGAPSTFYENHLAVANDPIEGPLNVNGVSFPGTPAVILGQNDRITWGATTNPLDVSDIFMDHVVGKVSGCSAQNCIQSGSDLLPVKFEVAHYLVNTPGDGILDNLVDAGVPFADSVIATVDDERRSFAPIVEADDPIALILGAETHVLTLQFTGFHGTTELETFRLWNRAKNLQDFMTGLKSFTFGSQNWAYADVDGNLGYFTSAELPLRKDLENGAVVGRPPYFVRDGASGEDNWVYDPAHSQGQVIPFAVLPYNEMPQTLNPSNHFFANANKDPAGTNLDNNPLNQHRRSKPSAIYYLDASYDIGLRAGRITRLLKEKLERGGKIGVDDLRRMQGNTQELDAELLVPFLLRSFSNATSEDAAPALASLAQDPRIVEAIGRLAAWDFSTPTGIPEGYDASDENGKRTHGVSRDEAARSVAATIYNAWRAQAIKSTVDSALSRIGASGVGSDSALNALHHLLSQHPFTGVGASGLDFFPEPAGLPPESRRDAVLLGALRDALNTLAGPAYAAAFGSSTQQDDYRWGKLHRITFQHLLGGAFNIPPAAGFTDLAPNLPGLSRDGGYEVINASSYDARAEDANSFGFGGGPVRRYVGSPRSGHTWDNDGIEGWNVIPGGSSGNPASPLYAKQLGDWLTVDQHRVVMSEADALRGSLRVETFSAPKSP